VIAFICATPLSARCAVDPMPSFFASSSSAAMISGRSAKSFTPSTPLLAAQRTHARAPSGVLTGPPSQPLPGRW
jgi:hypothetical protein